MAFEKNPSDACTKFTRQAAVTLKLNQIINVAPSHVLAALREIKPAVVLIPGARSADNACGYCPLPRAITFSSQGSRVMAAGPDSHYQRPGTWSISRNH